MNAIDVIYNGEVVDETALQSFNPEDVYKAVSAEIVSRQNDNYADSEAAHLQAWLGDFVVRFFGNGKE